MVCRDPGLSAGTEALISGLDVRGWQRTSLIDFPGHISTVLFTAGCNFRCPMCHNADLVLQPRTLPRVDLHAVWDLLERRRGKITGVVLTGGEPTLQPALPAFLEEIHRRGFRTKLDTNGYRPEVLRELIRRRLVDYVAMDVKGPPTLYARLAGLSDLDLARIETSLALLRDADVPYELRTTVVPGMLDRAAIEALVRWLAGLGLGEGASYVLQQFRTVRTLDPALQQVTPYGASVLQAMAEEARRWLPAVEVRGL